MTHRPALFLAFAFAAGIVLEHLLGPVVAAGAAAALLSVVLVLALVRSSFFPFCLLALFCLAGVLAAWNAAMFPAQHISRVLPYIKGHDVPVVCRVVSSMEERPGGLAPKRVFICALESVDGVPCSGRVMVNMFGPLTVVYGDRLRLTGKMSLPFDLLSGRVSFRAWLARQGIYALLHVKKSSPCSVLSSSGGWSLEKWALEARRALQRVFYRHLSPGEAGLMTAMLLGPRDGIPDHVYDVFRKTGTAHIIAISGMNMTFTAIGVMFLLGLFSMPGLTRAVLAVMMIGFYSFMAGNSAPVARSALMACAVILSFVMERETDALNSLGLAALILLAADPGGIRDVGWQLSFVCVASLIVIGPILLGPFTREGTAVGARVQNFFVESAAVTLAAFIGSAGILAYDFGYLALIGLVVNLPVIPLMALVTALGALLLATGVMLPWLAGYAALCLKVLLNAAVGLLSAAGAVPVMHCEGIPAWGVFFYYGVLGAGVVFYYRGAGRFATMPGGGAFIDKPMPL